MTTTRRLAADVAEYSRLIAVDNADTPDSLVTPRTAIVRVLALLASERRPA
jgi:hypothetical protein